MKTNLEISAGCYLRTNVGWNLRRKLFLTLGKFARLLDRAKAAHMVYVERNEQKHAGPLGSEQIEEMTRQQVARIGQSAPQRSKQELTDTILARPLTQLTMQQKGVKLLMDVVEANSSDIKSVANLGARIDIASSYLAEKFPNLTFTSVDFQPNLKAHNAFLKQNPNWNFMSGYPLHLLKSGKLKPDLIFMSSTSVLFNNVELDAYLDAFSNTAKFIVLNEPWSPVVRSLNLFRVTRPENVDSDQPYCGGGYSCYHHNYLAKLDERGFDVFLSRLIDGKEDYFSLQLAARNRRYQ